MEHIIDTKLQNLSCPLSLFVPITGGLIGRTRLTQALTGEKTLDQNVVDKLVALLDEMKELKDSSLIAPDWSDAVGVREQLAQRRAIKSAVEYDTDNIRRFLWENNESSK